jgi:hypothetical protein
MMLFEKRLAKLSAAISAWAINYEGERYILILDPVPDLDRFCFYLWPSILFMISLWLFLPLVTLIPKPIEGTVEVL